MAEINPIQGAIGPKDVPEKKEKQVFNLEKFKEEEKKVQKISETDPEAKKKRKRPEEEEEPQQVEEEPTVPLTSYGQFAPSPLDIQSSSSKTSGPPMMPQGPAQVPLKESYTPTAPSEPNLGDEGGFGDEDAFLQNLPEPPSGYTSSAPSSQLPSPTEEAPPPPPAAPPPAPSTPFSSQDFSQGQPQTPPQQNQYSNQNVPQSQSQTPATQNTQTPSSTQSTKAEPGALAPEIPGKTKKEVPGLKGLGTSAGESLSAKKTEPPKPAPLKPPSAEPTALPPAGKEGIEQKETFFKTLGAPPAPIKPATSKDGVKETESASSTEAAAPASITTSSSQSSQQDKGDQEKKDKDTSTTAVSGTPDIIQPFSLEGPSPLQEPLPAYTSFHPAVLEMFEKMVNTIDVLQLSSGDRKTTITINSQLPSSVFNGAQIVIEEDISIAPGQYNIKLLGSPEAVNLFQANMNDLVAAFQSDKYNFRVHRLEAGLQTGEKQMFKRREKIGGDDSGPGPG